MSTPVLARVRLSATHKGALFTRSLSQAAKISQAVKLINFYAILTTSIFVCFLSSFILIRTHACSTQTYVYATRMHTHKRAYIVMHQSCFNNSLIQFCCVHL